jgi:DNA polymerase-3 subunit delta
MIYLLHGKNSFESFIEMKRLRDSLISKESMLNVSSVEGDDIKSLDEIFSQSSMSSFFSTKSLLVVKRFFKNKSKNLKSQVAEILKSIDYDVIFWEEGDCDKRISLYKNIKKIGKVTEFPEKKFHELANWLSAEASNESITLDKKDAEKMVDRLGLDQNILYQELIKLITFVKANERDVIDYEDIRLVTAYQKEESIWDFVDSIAAQNKNKALIILENIFSELQDYPVILGLIVRQLRILFLAKKFQSSSQSEFASIASIHPFVAKKALVAVRMVSIDSINKAYERLLSLDYKVKKGIIDPKLGLDLFVLSFK